MAFANKFRTIIFAAAIAVPMASLPVAQAHAGVFVGISIGIAPPPLPVYVQPPLPAPGYLWTPGYWAYGDAGYYWVPGVWVQPPAVGLLWTPPYWGFADGLYGFHRGYWGPRVGFYGGVNYGFGYGGIGFVGGEWHGGVFAYNRAAANFGGVHVTNVYNNTTIVRQNTIFNSNHVAFNGGAGINVHPTSEQQQYAGQQHIQPTANQMQHQQFAAQDRSQLAAINHGRPGTMAASSSASYHQVAQQHERAQPITAGDRAAGAAYHPDGREANQDQRIANGLKSGQMTSGEAARADRAQSSIDRQTAADRAANGGRLNGQQRQQINGEQNAASRQIYNENHNGNTIAPNAVDNREAGRTNNRQANVDRQVHNDRTTGNFNRQQRQQVNREQNRDSKQINNQKHNDRERPGPKP